MFLPSCADRAVAKDAEMGLVIHYSLRRNTPSTIKIWFEVFTHKLHHSPEIYASLHQCDFYRTIHGVGRNSQKRSMIFEKIAIRNAKLKQDHFASVVKENRYFDSVEIGKYRYIFTGRSEHPVNVATIS